MKKNLNLARDLLRDRARLRERLIWTLVLARRRGTTPRPPQSPAKDEVKP